MLLSYVVSLSTFIVIKTLEVFLDNWTPIYFLAVSIKQTITKETSHIVKYANSVLSHMNTRAKDSNGYDILDSNDDTSQTEIPPTLFIEGLWIVAFHKSFFDREFHFLMGNDPEYGEDSHGCVARHYVPRVYAAHDHLQNLQNGGWETDPAFAKYREQLAMLPQIVDEKVRDGATKFFERTRKTFFDAFRITFNKWVVSSVRIVPDVSVKPDEIPNEMRMFPYIIGSHPRVAQVALAWLKAAYEWGEGEVTDADGEVILFHDEHVWPANEDVQLCSGESEGDDPITIRIDKCMKYLTIGVDPWKILEIDFIKDNLDLLFKMADAQVPVDINDKSTWGDEDYTTVADMIHQRIVAHPVHQQGCESHVQSGGHVRQTGVGEERGSQRLTLHSYIIRTSNSKFKQLERATRETEEDKKKVKTVWSAKRVHLFGEEYDRISNEWAEAAALLGDEKTISGVGNHNKVQKRKKH